MSRNSLTGSVFHPAMRSVARLLRRANAGVFCALALTGVLAAAPAAASTPVKSLWGPAQVDGVSQFPIYQELGVELLQTGIVWANIAQTRPANPTDPNDPAYRWPADLDLAVAEGARTDIDILVLVAQTPPWANGGRKPISPPSDPDDYAQFMEALAKRYPTVRHFMVWGEPNMDIKFQLSKGKSPDYYARKGDKLRPLKKINQKQRAQVAGYARLVDATYGRLKAVNSANVVIGGNTTTTGTIDPFNWARFMRLANGKPPRMDLYAHNPFGARGPNLAKDQLVEGTADMSDLDVFWPWVKKYQRRAGRNADLGLFISEYTAPTDQLGFEFPYYVTRPLQARWLRAAWNIAKSEKFYGFGWIALHDTDRRQYNGGISGIGLIDVDGRKKPSYAVFKSLR